MTSTDLAQGRAQVHHGSLEALRRRPVVLGLLGLLTLSVAIVAGVALGTVAVPVAETVAILAARLGVPLEQSWADTSETIVLTLRLPRVLTARRLGRTSRAGDESSWDITEPEAVALVVSAAAESSRGLFVPVWNGIIQAEDVRSVIDLDGAEVPPPGFERHGPVFPAEQLQASAVRGLKRVEGPLYPASDVFRKLLASAPSEADSTQREEWLRAVSAQLYHILPSGLRA